MPVEIIAAQSPTIVQSPDALVTCMIDDGTSEVILGHCSGTSITGVTIRPAGRRNEIYITPDRSREIKMYDGKEYLIMLVVRPDKNRELTFNYNSMSRTWTLVKG